MTARLILIRHGNTFDPSDEPVWVGARTDMPLVEKGLDQARAVGEALKRKGVTPDALIAGPLQRTRRSAEIIADLLGLAPSTIRIDRRLTEIDYGAWEGKPTAALIASGYDAEMAAWNKNSIFPASAGWSPSEAQIIADVGALLSEAEEGTTVLVTSNGILRFFARAALNAREFPDRKVATGHLCAMECGENGGWRIVAWNQAPQSF